MDIKSLKEEMQFITNTITDDLEYLLYLLLKDGLDKDKPNIVESDIKEEINLNSVFIENWFNSL
jgi:cell pole-organizing protein PopZ